MKYISLFYSLFIVSIFFAQENNLYYAYDTSYNVEGKPVLSRIRDAYNLVIDSTQYHKNGQVETKKKYNKEGKVEEKTVYVYNDKDLLIEETRYTSQNGCPLIAYESKKYAYDSIGNIVQFIEFQLFNTSLDTNFKTIYAYNDKNLVIYKLYKNFNGKRGETEVHYVYDSVDNLIEEKVENSGVFMYIEGASYVLKNTYDASGNLIERRKVYTDEEHHPRITTFQYNANGKLIDKIDSVGNVRNVRKTYSYTAFDSVLEISTYERNNVLHTKEKRTYDSNRMVIKIENLFYSDSGGLSEKKIKVYVLGKCIREENFSYKWINNNAQLLQYNTIKYNDKGQLTGEYFYSKEGILGQVREYTYNAKGSLLEELEYYKNYTNISKKVVYTYNDKGSLITEIRYGKEGKVVYKNTYTYNFNNQILEEIESGINTENERGDGKKVNYFYESQGVLAKKVEHKYKNEGESQFELYQVIVTHYTKSLSIAYTSEFKLIEGKKVSYITQYSPCTEAN